MSKIFKKRKNVLSKYDREKTYSLMDASSIVKDITSTKFDASSSYSIVYSFKTK